MGSPGEGVKRRKGYLALIMARLTSYLLLAGPTGVSKPSAAAKGPGGKEALRIAAAYPGGNIGPAHALRGLDQSAFPTGPRAAKDSG
jgi:hypothetical protein